MEEEQIFEQIDEEVTAEGNPQLSQQSQQAQQSQPSQPAQQGQQSQQPQQTSSSTQPQAAGIETNDNVIEEAEKHGQPSNTITEWQRVHDKGYVERITEKTEKH